MTRNAVRYSLFPHRIRNSPAQKRRRGVGRQPSIEILESRPLLATLVDLSALSGVALTSVTAISGDGSTVGALDSQGNGYLVNTVTGKYQTFPLPAFSNIHSVNNHGEALISEYVGGTYPYNSYLYENGSISQLIAPQGFLIPHNLTPDPLPLPRPLMTVANSINDSGIIVGFVEDSYGYEDAYEDVFGTYVEVVLSATDIKEPSQAATTIADNGAITGTTFGDLYTNLGINDTYLGEKVVAFSSPGQIVGSIFGPVIETSHPYTYEYSGIDGYSESGGAYVGIFANGLVENGALPDGVQGFYSVGQGFTVIPTTHGGLIQMPEGHSINDSGLAVGNEDVTITAKGMPATDFNPFIFDGTKKIDLSSLTSDIQGWTAGQVVGVGNNGLIVGDGVHNGVSTVYVLNPNASSVTLTDFSWNIDADGTAANAGHRGLDFSYNVSGTIPAGTTIPIAFYWATGTDPSTIISPAYSYGQTVPDVININTTPGNHGHGTGESFLSGNDPARWGMPPSNAAFVMAIIDPNDVLNESDFKHRVLTEILPNSPSDILNNSVIATIDRITTIQASFVPGSGIGKPIPISEAEVYLGIDHFNWIQTITSTPPTWKNIIFLNLDLARRKAYGIEYFEGGIYYRNPDKKTLDFASPITYVPIIGSFLDPVEEPTNGLMLKYGTIYDDKYISVTPLDSDIYSYYWDEPSEIQDYVNGFSVDFNDSPSQPSSVNPFQNGYLESFKTTLVGVSYNTSVYDNYSDNYKGSFFSWNSDVVVDSASKYAGGYLDVDNKNPHHISSSAVISGGVSNITYPDPGTVNSTTDFSLATIPDQITHLGISLSVDVTAHSIAPLLPISYALNADHSTGATISIAGLAATALSHIDPNSGIVTFIPQTIGTFPVTVRAKDQDGRIALTTFNITVLPALTPPTVTVGPNGIATSGLVFTRQGSFQVADSTDTFTATVDYGDSTGTFPLALNADHTFTLAHTYNAPGAYTALVVVTGKDSVSGTSSIVITVSSPPVPPSSPPVTVPTAPVSPIPPNTMTAPTPEFNPLAFSPVELGRYTFVTSLYQTILRRSPDSYGLLYWLASLAEGRSATQVARDFFNSAEYRAIHPRKPSFFAFRSALNIAINAGEKAAIVSTIYHVVLNRSPDANGFSFWVNQLAYGTSVKSVAASFYGSKEFLHLHNPIASNVKSAVFDANRNAKIVAT